MAVSRPWGLPAPALPRAGCPGASLDPAPGHRSGVSPRADTANDPASGRSWAPKTSQWEASFLGSVNSPYVSLNRGGKMARERGEKMRVSPGEGHGRPRCQGTSRCFLCLGTSGSAENRQAAGTTLDVGLAGSLGGGKWSPVFGNPGPGQTPGGTCRLAAPEPQTRVSLRCMSALAQVRGLDRRRPGFLLQPDDAAVRVGEARGPEAPRRPQQDPQGPAAQAQAGRRCR